MNRPALLYGLFLVVILFLIGHVISILPFKATITLILFLIFSFLTITNLEIGLLFLIFVVPFTQQITLIKLSRAPVHFGIDDIIILCIMLSWLAGMIKRKEPAFLKTPLNWPFVAFFTICLFSFVGPQLKLSAYSIASNFRPETSTIAICALHLFKFFEYVIIYFIVISAINNLQQVKKYVLMFFIVTIFIAILQFIAIGSISGFGLGLPMLSSDKIQLVMASMQSFTSNSIMGAYYIFFVSITIAMILNTPKFQRKGNLIFLAVFLSFALFNSFSRAAYLGLLASILVMAILKKKRFFLIVLLLFIFSPIYLQAGVLERITITIQNLHPTLVLDESAAIRLVIWKKALKIFLDNPFFGNGFWTTRYVLRNEAHSQYLSLLLEIGVIGLSVFFWLIIRMFKNAMFLFKKSEDYFMQSLALGYIAGLAGVMVTCFFSENFESFQLTGPLWFITGLITSANRLLPKKPEGGG